MTTIESVDAWEVLDSRGHPTVRVRVETETASGTFTVPAGASTGAHEAVEVRDGDDRYGGRGVKKAVEAVGAELAPEIIGRDATDQRGIDAALTERDGEPDLSRLGANAVLGVSGAVFRATSGFEPLYEYVPSILENEPPGLALPTPTVNVLSGGLHARGGIEIQDFLVVPRGAETYAEALETVWSVRRSVRDRILENGHRPLVADEGGFAPPLASVEEAFTLLAASVRDAGYEPARDDVAFAVDVAATHFYDPEREVYELESVGESCDAGEMIDLVAGWVTRWPLVSVEDALAEDDWTGWNRLRERIGDDALVLGDDLLVTNSDRVERAIEERAVSALLVKPNQAGTITRTIDAVELASENGVEPVISARSGETCDSTIADLAVGLGAPWIKIGSLARSERLAKYNRLLEIERDGIGFPN